MTDANKPDAKPSETAIHLASQCWQDKETETIEFDHRLAMAFAKRFDALMTKGGIITQIAHRAIVSAVREERDALAKELESEKTKLACVLVHHGKLETELAAANAEIERLKDTPGGKRIYGALARIKELEAELEKQKAFRLAQRTQWR